MRSATILVVALALVLLVCGLAPAKKNVATPTTSPAYSGDAGQTRWPNTVFWFDDIEGDVSEWVTDDLSAGAAAHFHTDTYMAYGDTGYSWWCGTFDYDADGGYGNSWDDRLNIPTTDVTGATYPILTYAFRHDSEPAYDFTYVQAESSGIFVNLNRGYDGAAPWTDLGIYGFVIVSYDNPFVARFRFISDGAYSDEDGDYLSVGGAFMCDNVQIYDYFGGYVYFYDDANDGVGLCQPVVPSAAGDYWHVISRACPALSDPHSWWCGDDADTGLVPSNLQNVLYSPLVELSTALSCTVHFAMHFAMPTVDNDYVSMFGTSDGVTYNGLGGWWGDFGQCDG
ncbi:MAG: hypothetical protein JXB46_01640, partial [Candidatus Eisenbacteria bacterium]|nr:hypothetical protein [Candidatus Eisenbacteria bacterium]